MSSLSASGFGLQEDTTGRRTIVVISGAAVGMFCSSGSMVPASTSMSCRLSPGRRFATS